MYVDIMHYDEWNNRNRRGLNTRTVYGDGDCPPLKALMGSFATEPMVLPTEFEQMGNDYDPSDKEFLKQIRELVTAGVAVFYQVDCGFFVKCPKRMEANPNLEP